MPAHSRPLHPPTLYHPLVLCTQLEHDISVHEPSFFALLGVLLRAKGKHPTFCQTFLHFPLGSLFYSHPGATLLNGTIGRIIVSITWVKYNLKVSCVQVIPR